MARFKAYSPTSTHGDKPIGAICLEMLWGYHIASNASEQSFIIHNVGRAALVPVFLLKVSDSLC